MKKFFILMALIAVMISSTCYAMRISDFSIGGISLNMPYNDVIRTYGQPTSHPGGWAQLVTDCIKYGNDVEIGFLGKKVRYVVVTSNNGWKTAAGVNVGMSLNNVISIYGNNYTTVNRTVNFDHERQHLYTNLTGTEYIWSQVADVYSYSPGDTKYILSVVVNNDRVSAIKISQSTPES